MAKSTSKLRKAPKLSGRTATRSQHLKLVDDVDVLAEDSGLTAQLKAMGLYEASTKGDGNCLFRALSEQLYGSSNGHLQLRREICDYVEGHPDKYKLFVDEDSIPGGFTAHVNSMRIQGSYGTHIELSAFAQIYQRSVTVIQRGLVYVVGFSPSPSSTSSTSTHPPPPVKYIPPPTSPLKKSAKARGKLKALQQSEGVESVTDDAGTEEEELGPICIAYHTSWEHYTSLRNLTGPHFGLPRLKEITNLASQPNSSTTTPDTSSTPEVLIDDEDVDDRKEEDIEGSDDPDEPDLVPFSMSSLHPYPRSTHSRNSSLNHLHPPHSNSNPNFSSNEYDTAPSTPTSSIPDSPEAEPAELSNGEGGGNFELGSRRRSTRNGGTEGGGVGGVAGKRSSSKRTESPVNYTSEREDGDSSNKSRLRSGRLKVKPGQERGLTRRQRRTEELKNGGSSGGGGRKESPVVAQVEIEKMKMLYI